MAEFKIRKRIVQCITETIYDNGTVETEKGDVYIKYDIMKVEGTNVTKMASCEREETVHRYFDEFLSDFTRTKEYDDRALTPKEGYLAEMLRDVAKRYNGNPDGLKSEISVLREMFNQYLEHIEMEFHKV